MEKRYTAGKIIKDHMEKTWDEKDGMTPMDYAQMKTPKYIEELVDAAERGRKLYKGDFYIDVQKKEETIFKGKRVFKDNFIPKKACPTPNDDQDVYVYKRMSDTIEYLWSVPDRNTVDYLIENALLIPKEQKQLLGFCMDYKDGTLKKRAMELNGEI